MFDRLEQTKFKLNKCSVKLFSLRDVFDEVYTQLQPDTYIVQCCEKLVFIHF